MNNPLVLEIGNLYELIESMENEQEKLVDSSADDNILHHNHGAIEMLKERLQSLEELLWDDSLPNRL